MVRVEKEIRDMKPVTLKRNIFQRIIGIPATKSPMDEECWAFSDGKITIDLNRAPELSKTGGALRLEKKNLTERVLVIRGDDDNYYAFRNKCKHMSRRLDPVHGTQTVQCCSVFKATYDYEGKVLFGPAKEAVDIYQVQVDNGKLVIRL